MAACVRGLVFLNIRELRPPTIMTPSRFSEVISPVLTNEKAVVAAGIITVLQKRSHTHKGLNGGKKKCQEDTPVSYVQARVSAP